MVKVNYCIEGEDFSEVIQSSQIPVVIAGGEQMDAISLLKMIKQAIECGVSGISIGRNIFQSDIRDGLLQSIGKIVHEYNDLNTIIREYSKDKFIS